MKNYKITLSEVLSELDKYRGRISYNKFTPTEEQKLFIAYSLFGNNKKVTYPVFIKYWQKLGWEKISRATLFRYSKQHKDELMKLLKKYKTGIDFENNKKQFSVRHKSR